MLAFSLSTLTSLGIFLAEGERIIFGWVRVSNPFDRPLQGLPGIPTASVLDLEVPLGRPLSGDEGNGGIAFSHLPLMGGTTAPGPG